MTSSGTNPQGRPGAAAWELLLPAASAPARARGRSLQAALREAVRSGRLAPGTRLPSSRDLAADLRVSRGLITEAYEQLTAEGYLRSGRGAGTWVGGAVRAARTRARDLAPRSPGARADFVPGTPDLSLFPRAAWAGAHRAVLAGLPHQDLGYPDPRGLPRLRTALAELLARRRGAVVDPERLVVVSGVAQGTALLGAVLHARGIRAVGVEDPGSPQHSALYAAAGVGTVALPLDGEGPALAPLRRSGVRVVVTTPAHQFPTGIACSARRRAELLDWARSVDGFVFEDDYDGDFRYDRAPVGALQGLDPERVVYAGSVSKSLAPGLRLGWLLVPDALADEIVARKRTADLGHPTVDQAAFAHFVERGDYDRQLRRCQRAYRERRDALVAALTGHFPGVRVSGIAAGLHLIADLPGRYGPEERFLARVTAAGVAVRTLTAYRHARVDDGVGLEGVVDPEDGDGSAEPDEDRGTGGGGEDRGTGGGGEGRGGGVRLVLGYAHVPPARIREGVRLMAEAAAG
ncbi:PLP-dependent aminotransferase family protein [Streptomyces sp. 16-176A]|uniref:MocR-like pyridoxine biosynthesis transcription factor PdxR n=1 Tax=Streptomyces sp. 16-176A TaxID=2530458 RepID=UPI00345C7C31